MCGSAESVLLSRGFQSDGFAVNLGCGGSKAAKEILSLCFQRCICLPEEIKILEAIAANCWNQLFANACNIKCFGAYPGFPTCMEINGENPTLSVPQEKLLDREDYSKVIVLIEESMGLQRDPWGLGLFLFSSQST
jgi:hypothetical protein